MSAHRVRPATVKTRTLRTGLWGSGEGAVGAAVSVPASSVIEAERGEGIPGQRNGFAFSDHPEGGFQIVGQL